MDWFDNIRKTAEKAIERFMDQVEKQTKPQDLEEAMDTFEEAIAELEEEIRTLDERKREIRAKIDDMKEKRKTAIKRLKKMKK